MQRKGTTHSIFKKLYNENPLEYKAVMRAIPTQVEILLNLIVHLAEIFCLKKILLKMLLETQKHVNSEKCA